MATFDDMQTAIQAVADGYADDVLSSYALRTPGDLVEILPGVEIEPGSAWGSKSMEIMLRGLANWVDAEGIGGFKAKINEIIGEYNQLLSDYNNGIKPSTANTIVPL